MKMLIDASERCGINILFAGASLDNEIEEIIKSKKNIKYFGKYDYNSEIAKLYGQVDCIYSVYDADMNNVKVALPNKLYESILCELPIIVAKGTYLAVLVEKMGVGIAVSHKDERELEQVIRRLSTDKKYYDSFVRACRVHKKDVAIEPYNERLKLMVDEIMSKF